LFRQFTDPQTEIMGGSSIESQKAHIETFDAWKEHCDLPRLETDLVLLEILRDTHPQYHITQTSSYACDLLGFAKAGHATATIDDNDTRYNASRYYRPSPGPRMLKKPGTLVDAVKFGRWLYTWEEKEYILYQADYGAARPHQMSFILSPRDGNETQERYHPATDALLLAVGTWSTALHDEIYVFDNGVWIKDKALWKSVQDASWDEVILNREMKANLIDDIQGKLSRPSLLPTNFLSIYD
jgi:transitional endoplasmic reticulum ATPase